MNRQSFIKTLLAIPLAIVGGKAVKKEEEKDIPIAWGEARKHTLTYFNGEVKNITPPFMVIECTPKDGFVVWDEIQKAHQRGETVMFHKPNL